MPKLPVVPARKVLKALSKAGFYIDHATGAHQSLRHPTKEHIRVTVALHAGDIKRKTLQSILKQAEMTVDEFIDLL